MMYPYLDFFRFGSLYILPVIFHSGGSPRLRLAVYGLVQLLPPENERIIND